VLSVGGDGTANEVGPRPPGPHGRARDRADGLRQRPRARAADPAAADRALDALEMGVRRAIDVGMINGRPFLNVAGVGFDAPSAMPSTTAGARAAAAA
jgi:diacylglycerol kinase family enzyme